MLPPGLNLPFVKHNDVLDRHQSVSAPKSLRDQKEDHSLDFHGYCQTTRDRGRRSCGMGFEAWACKKTSRVVTKRYESSETVRDVKVLSKVSLIPSDRNSYFDFRIYFRFSSPTKNQKHCLESFAAICL